MDLAVASVPSLPQLAAGSTQTAADAPTPPGPTLREPRRIIFFCDGTGSGPTCRDTNVWRLYRVVEHAVPKPGEIEQVLIWEPGVGTEPGETRWDVALGGKLNVKIRKAYEKVLAAYEPGDEIVFVGFSRGAFIVRTLAAVIGDVGLNKHMDLDSVFEAYAGFPTWENAGAKGVKPKVVAAQEVLARWRSTPSSAVKIRALALFDTVGAIGFPSYTHLPESRYFGFGVETVGPHVDHIFHALALDDTRRPFLPTRVELTPEGIAQGQDLQQCWFGGWHADVGGGWDVHEMAAIPLIWMAAHLQDANLVRIDVPSLLEIPGGYTDAKKAGEEQHPHPHLSFARLQPPTAPWGAGLWWVDLHPFFKWIPRSTRPPVKGNDTIHASVYNSTQSEMRKKWDAKRHALLEELSCPSLLPLEVLGKACWPVVDP